MRAHITNRARALGGTDLLPQSWNRWKRSAALDPNGTEDLLLERDFMEVAQ